VTEDNRENILKAEISGLLLYMQRVRKEIAGMDRGCEDEEVKRRKNWLYEGPNSMAKKPFLRMKSTNFLINIHPPFCIF
jgi:hypothetical protein